jgi:hypothetical protein
MNLSPIIEFELFTQTDKVEGMVIARFPDLARGRLIQEGERYTRREVDRSSVVFLQYGMLPKEYWKKK